MRLLLDTHVLLWWLGDDDRLTEPLRSAISDPRALVVVSAASAWEMAIKAALGKLSLPTGLSDELDRLGFDTAPVTLDDALAAGALPRHHDDPFDRMLVAQAIRRDLVLVSVDVRLAQYDVRLMS